MVEVTYAAAGLSGLVALGLLDSMSVERAVLVVGGAHLVACASAFGAGGSLPSLRGGAAWLSGHRSQLTHLVTEQAATIGSSYSALWLIGVTHGLAALGLIRVGQVVFGAYTTLTGSVRLVLTPRLARAASPGVVLRDALLASGILAGLAVSTGIAYWLLPEQARVYLLGPSAVGFGPLLLVTMLQRIADGALASTVPALRVLVDHHTASLLRVGSSILLLLVVGGATIYGDLHTVLWAMALFHRPDALLWFGAAFRISRPLGGLLHER